MEEKFVNKEIKGTLETNIEKLRKLFPSVVKDGQVDFEELKNELGVFEEISNEKYEFSWVGKQNSKQEAQNGISGMTLKYYPEESKNADTTENIYIEGDNLKVLKLLRANYANKIKMIYIDPPYNRGTDSFIYPDNYKTNSKITEEQLGISNEGEKNINLNKDNWYKNTKDSSMYHSAWLSMIYSRLKIAWELLTDDGIIFISIDDNELNNLLKVCNEIFNENNFLILFTRETKKGGKATNTFAKNHDYVLAFAKNVEEIKIKGIAHNDKGYKNKDEFFEERGYYKLNQTLDYNTLGYVNSLDYPIEIDNKIYYPGNVSKEEFEKRKLENPKDGFRWRWSKDLFEFGLKNGWIIVSNTGRIYTKTYLNATIEKNENDDYYIEYKDRTKAITSLDLVDSIFSNDNSKKELEILMGNSMFDYVKPTSLVKYLMQSIVEENDIILDFFSGSATTADSVMQYNAENSKNIKFIMIQIPEECEEKTEAYKAGYKNICEIGKERIRRAGDKIKNETNADIDYGFKVFKLDETNINWEKQEFKDKVDNYLLLRTDEEKEELLKDFVDGAKDIDIVYELMLRYYGIPLSAKITKLDNIGNRTYSIDDIIIVCLEDKITNEIVDKLSNIDFAKLYLRDSSFKGENSLEIKENLMIRLDLQKEYKDEKSYRVEFI